MRILFLIFLLLTSTYTFAEGEQSKTVKKLVESYTECLISKDTTKLKELLIPRSFLEKLAKVKLIEDVGSRAKADSISQLQKFQDYVDVGLKHYKTFFLRQFITILNQSDSMGIDWKSKTFTTVITDDLGYDDYDIKKTVNINMFFNHKGQEVPLNFTAFQYNDGYWYIQLINDLYWSFSAAAIENHIKKDLDNPSDYKLVRYGEFFEAVNVENIKQELKTDRPIHLSFWQTYSIGNEEYTDYFYLDSSFSIIGAISSERLSELASKDIISMIEESVNLESESGNTNTDSVNSRKEYEILLLTGIMQLHKNEYKKAIEYLSSAIEINPENPIAYFHRGKCYRESNKEKQACKDFIKADELGYKDSELDKELENCK